MTVNKSDTPLTDKSLVHNNVNFKTFLLRQYITDPLEITDFTGSSVKLVIRCAVSSTTSTSAFLSKLVRLYHSDGSFTNLLIIDSTGTAYSTTPGTRAFSANLVSVQSQAGDRLVVELGVNLTGTSTASRTYTERFGNPAATGDFALANGLTTDLDPWIEFSAFPQASTLSASISFSGSILLKPSHLYFTAALDFAGSVGGFFSRRIFQGALSFSGGFVKRVQRLFSGSLTSTGVSKRSVSTKRTATLSFSVASFSPIHLFNTVLTATLSFVGSMPRVIRSLRKSILDFVTSFTVSSSGGGGIQYLQTLIALLPFSTTQPRSIQSVQFSTLNPQSGGSNVTSSNQSGSVSFAGNQVRAITKSAIAAILSLLGSLTQQKAKIFAGVLNFSTTMRRGIGSIQASVLGLGGFLPKFIDYTGDAFNAVLSFIGLRVDSMQIVVQGATVMRITVRGATLMKVTAKEK